MRVTTVTCDFSSTIEARARGRPCLTSSRISFYASSLISLRVPSSIHDLMAQYFQYSNSRNPLALDLRRPLNLPFYYSHSSVCIAMESPRLIISLSLRKYSRIEKNTITLFNLSTFYSCPSIWRIYPRVSFSAHVSLSVVSSFNSYEDYVNALIPARTCSRPSFKAKDT